MSKLDGTDPWYLYGGRRPDAGLRLFCFPWAGVGASVYHTWPAAMPDSVEVLGLQPPGRESRHREAPFTRLEPLLDAMVPALLPELDRPFAFFGYSLGAIVAYEAALELRRRGAAMPEALFLCATAAPQCPKPYPVPEGVSDEELLDWIRRVYAPPEAAWRVPEVMALTMGVLRADFSIYAAYDHRAEAPLDLPIHVFGGDADPGAPAELLEAWRERTTREFDAQLFAGRHFFIQEHQRELQQAVARTLSRLPGASS